MGGLMPKVKRDKALEAQAAASERRLKQTEAELEKAKTPTPMPDDKGGRQIRERMIKQAQAASEGGSPESTALTGSRLGDASMATGRRGRIKSAVMTGGA